MKIIREEAHGNLLIEQDSQYFKLRADSVVVAPNVRVRLYGVISEKIVIKPGSKVNFHGRIMGEIINEGGELQLYEGEA